jgi:plastocyanin
MIIQATRRTFLAAGGLGLAGLAVPRLVRAAPVVEVRLRATEKGDVTWFDPIGLLLEPGQTVRWVVERDAHTSTAYHPANDRHALRIPEKAKPWDSGFLMEKGAKFEVNLTVEGVYDYFCLPHEDAGMVGRIIVGKPSGLGTLPFDYFKGKKEAKDWKAVPPAAQKAFPSVEAIMKQKIVRRAEQK